MNVKDIISAGADALIVCTAKDLRDAFMSIFDIQRENTSKQVNDESHNIVSADEVCKLLGVTKATLWRWAKLNYLVPVKVGRKNFYLKSDLEAISGQKGVFDEV